MYFAQWVFDFAAPCRYSRMSYVSDKFTRDDVIAPFLLLSVVIVTHLGERLLKPFVAED